MFELISAIQSFRTALASKDPHAIRLASAALLIAIGQAWQLLEQGAPFGANGDGDDSGVELHGELCAAIEDMGGVVPVASGGLVIKILLPILLKLIADQFSEGQ